jgi:hypothetical protein
MARRLPVQRLRVSARPCACAAQSFSLFGCAVAAKRVRSRGQIVFFRRYESRACAHVVSAQTQQPLPLLSAFPPISTAPKRRPRTGTYARHVPTHLSELFHGRARPATARGNTCAGPEGLRGRARRVASELRSLCRAGRRGALDLAGTEPGARADSRTPFRADWRGPATPRALPFEEQEPDAQPRSLAYAGDQVECIYTSPPDSHAYPASWRIPQRRSPNNRSSCRPIFGRNFYLDLTHGSTGRAYVRPAAPRSGGRLLSIPLALACLRTCRRRYTLPVCAFYTRGRH